MRTITLLLVEAIGEHGAAPARRFLLAQHALGGRGAEHALATPRRRAM